MAGFWERKMWHGLLGRPYRLAKPVDAGQGPVVVLLHGLGRSAAVWQPLVAELAATPCRLVAFDLLGFGASPKPAIDYTVDDHARAVLAAIKAARPQGPVILVGHSMGSLVAVRVARLQPRLVKHLVLYEMPLYGGLPEKHHYQIRLELYFKLYERIMGLQPDFSAERPPLKDRALRQVIGPEVTADTWLPYVRSLANTIVQQTTAQDIKRLRMPLDVIYGSLDILVIRGKVQSIFGADAPNITAHTIRARHTISHKAAVFLAQRITVATGAGESDA